MVFCFPTHSQSVLSPRPKNPRSKKKKKGKEEKKIPQRPLLEHNFEFGGAQQQVFTRVFPRSTTISTLAQAAEDEFKISRALLGGIVLGGWKYGNLTPYDLSETITVGQMISEMRSRLTVPHWSFLSSDGEDNKGEAIETVELELFTIPGCAKRAEDMLLYAVHGYRWAQRGLGYLSRKATKDEVELANISDQQREYMEKISWAAKTLYPSMLVMPPDVAPPELSNLTYLNSPGARLAPDDYEAFIETYIVHQAWLPRYVATVYPSAIGSAEEDRNVLISFDPQTITVPDVSLRSSHSFRVTTGAVLWGQLHTIIAGSQASGYDRNGESIPEELPGGTIIQRCYRYRCAARNGVWGIWRAYVIEGSAGVGGQPDRNHLGWVVCHKDADPKDILMRAASVTKGGGKGGYGGKEHIDRVRSELASEFTCVLIPWP